MSQDPPNPAHLQNENNPITALKNHIVNLENEILFLKKIKIKKKKNGNIKQAHFYFELNATINAKAISSERAKS